MKYVLPESVMYKFKKYLEEYGNMISKELAIEELQDALDSAECTEVRAWQYGGMVQEQ